MYQLKFKNIEVRVRGKRRPPCERRGKTPPPPPPRPPPSCVAPGGSTYCICTCAISLLRWWSPRGQLLCFQTPWEGLCMGLRASSLGGKVWRGSAQPGLHLKALPPSPPGLWVSLHSSAFLQRRLPKRGDCDTWQGPVKVGGWRTGELVLLRVDQKVF